MNSAIKFKEDQQLSKKINAFLIEYFNFLAFVILILILLGGSLFLILPKYKTVSEQISNAKLNQEETIFKQKAHLAQLNRLNDVYDKISSKQKSQIDSLLPEGPQAEKLMVQLEILMRQNGIPISNLSVDADDMKVIKGKEEINSGEKKIKELKIKINLVGLNYESVKKLLSAIEKNLRILDVNALQFSPTGGPVALDMTAYYLK